MDARFADALARLPDYFGNHVLVSVTALVLGLAVSLPLAIASLRRPVLRAALLAATSIVQTIPGLALLALFYPLLLGAAALSERTLGFGFSALGFLPAVLALALYSMLPVVRNTITGIMGIDPAIKRAALGVGMTESQSLRMVELPLALPVIMAGVRTASVWVIGTATLSTPIGQTSLGNYIFAGLQTQNWIFVLFGCVAAAVLALAVDQLLALIERGYASRRSQPCGRRRRGPRTYRSAGSRPQPVGDTRRLCHRRQAVCRAIHPRCTHRGSAARQGARLPRGAMASARPLSSMRSRPATSMPTSNIPERSGPTRCSAPMCCRASRCWRRLRRGSKIGTGSPWSAVSASRTPTRWR